MQNANAGVTKETYLEICEAMGNEPLESEMPVDVADLPLEVQQVLLLFNVLPDTWEYMGGNYTGKDLSNLPYMFELYSIEPGLRKYSYELIRQLDKNKAELIRNKKPAK